MLRKGKFYSVDQSKLTGKWMKDEFEVFRALLDQGVSSGKGLDETTLLNWFGASEKRIALLAYATHGVVPTSVGREISLGAFRSDFAWAAVDNLAAPTVVFIEFEGALEDTLFQQRKGRMSPYIGQKFLEGFSQIVDWCSFGQHDTKSNPLISALLRGTVRKPLYHFSLVAGLDEFVNDPALEARFTWWKQNIKYGDGADMHSFTQIYENGMRKIRHWNQT